MRFKTKINEKNHKLYWGTLHNHSTLSWDVFRGKPEKIYTLARKQGLDFCSITEHDSPFGVGENKKIWKKSIKYANRYNDPGKFITFIGYEWTSGQGLPFYRVIKSYLRIRHTKDFNFKSKFHGHKNVYFLNENVPEIAFAWNNKNYDTPKKLWKNLQDYDAITITHHPLGGPTPPAKWKYWNPKMEPLVEIYSQHGNSESKDCRYRVYKPNIKGKHSVQDALNKGYILGFTAGTDSHCYSKDALGEFGGWLKLLKIITNANKIPGPGITAVYSKKLTKESLWNSFLNRRTYATTGDRIKVIFKMNDYFMGDIVKTKKKPKFKFEVNGTDKIKAVEIIKNGNSIYKINPKEKDYIGKFKDKSQLKDHNYYYLRILQENGHMAWSSPIWIKK